MISETVLLFVVRLLVLSGLQITHCHRKNPKVLLLVRRKNTIGSNFNSKLQMVLNLVHFEVPSKNGTDF